MKITKMQGLGNDYIYVNGLEETIEDPAALARAYMEQGMRLNDAAKRAAQETGAKKSDIYRILTENS